MRDLQMEGVYKALRRDGQGWVEGYFYLDTNETPLISSFLCDENSDTTLELEIDPSALCRYADTEDRNGTPIFENDIIRITGKGERLVKWSMKNLAWMYSANSEKPYNDYGGYLSEIPRLNITVIGNLFNERNRTED